MPEFQKKKSLREIKPDHVERYKWAIREIEARFPEGGYVLDAACGIGYGSRMMAERGFTVHSIDRSLEAVHWHFDYFRHANIRMSLGDLMDVPLDRYDAIVTIETIEHIPDGWQWVERCKQHTDMLIGTVPNEDVIAHATANNPWHYRHYTIDEFDEMMPWNKRFFTQYGRFEKAEMVEGTDGMTLGAVCVKE